jgi:hypothetical protein
VSVGELVGAGTDAVGEAIAVEVIASAASARRSTASPGAAGVFVADAIASVASEARASAISVSRQDRSTFSILAARRVGS